MPITSFLKPPLIESFPPSVPDGLTQALGEMTRLVPYLNSVMPYTYDTRSEFDVLLMKKSDIYYVLDCEACQRPDAVAQGKVAIRPIVAVGFVAWVNDGHPLASAAHVSLAEVAEFPVLVPGCLEVSTYRSTVEGIFRQKDLSPLFRTVFADNATALLVTPPKESEVIIVPDFVYMQSSLGLRRLPVSDAPPASIGIAHLVPFANPLVERFVEVLLKQSY